MEKIEIKNKKLFKNKLHMVVCLVLFGILIYLFIYLGTLDYGKNLADNLKFANEFPSVGEDNVFKYVDANMVRIIASGKSGIVLFGTDNEWVEHYANILNDVATELGVKEIYYYDFFDNRVNNNGSYEDIVLKLKDYVEVNDRGIREIYAPTLLIMKDNKVIYFDSETSFVKGNAKPNSYWDIYTRNKKEQEFRDVLLKYIES